MLDLQVNLGNNSQLSIDQQVERPIYCPFGRIFDRNNPVIALSLLNCLKDIRDIRKRTVSQGGPEILDRGLVGIGCFRSEVPDNQILLQSNGCGNNFPLNRTQGIDFHRARIDGLNFIEDLFLPGWIVRVHA